MVPLVVEGLTDVVFFTELFKSYLSEFSVQPTEQPGRRGIPASISGRWPDGSSFDIEFRNINPEKGGKSQIPGVVEALIRAGNVAELAVARDLNGNKPEEVIAPLKQTVESLLGGPVEEINEHRFRVQNKKLGKCWVSAVLDSSGSERLG